MNKEIVKNIGLKFSYSLGYRRVIILLLVLFVLLLITYGFFLYQFRMINLAQIDMHRYFQERELYISKFYNSFNKNDLINELYFVTNDSKYLQIRNENLNNINRDFDSLYRYCRESEDYCSRLDTSRYLLEQYLNQVLPENDRILDIIQSGTKGQIEIKKFKPGISGFQYDQISIDISQKEYIGNYLADNLKIAEDEVLKPTKWIVKEDREQKRVNQKSVDEKIEMYNKLQRIIIILSIGVFIVLAITLIYIINRPFEKALPVLNTLPNKQYSAIYEDFENELYNILEKSKELFQKYDLLVLIFPRGRFFPIEIIAGMQKFCQTNSITFDVWDKLKNDKINDKQVYVTLEDETLVKIIEETGEKNLEIGKNIGILAYGDSPLKSIAAGGITVIQTEFEDSELTTIRDRKRERGNYLTLIKRNSL